MTTIHRTQCRCFLCEPREPRNAKEREQKRLAHEMLSKMCLRRQAREYYLTKRKEQEVE